MRPFNMVPRETTSLVKTHWLFDRLLLGRLLGRFPSASHPLTPGAIPLHFALLYGLIRAGGSRSVWRQLRDLISNYLSVWEAGR